MFSLRSRSVNGLAPQVLDLFQELCSLTTTKRLLSHHPSFQYLIQVVACEDSLVVSKVVSTILDVICICPPVGVLVSCVPPPYLALQSIR